MSRFPSSFINNISPDSELKKRASTPLPNSLNGGLSFGGQRSIGIRIDELAVASGVATILYGEAGAMVEAGKAGGTLGFAPTGKFAVDFNSLLRAEGGAEAATDAAG